MYKVNDIRMCLQWNFPLTPLDHKNMGFCLYFHKYLFHYSFWSPICPFCYLGHIPSSSHRAMWTIGQGPPVLVRIWYHLQYHVRRSIFHRYCENAKIIPWEYYDIDEVLSIDLPIISHIWWGPAIRYMDRTSCHRKSFMNACAVPFLPRTLWGPFFCRLWNPHPPWCGMTGPVEKSYQGPSIIFNALENNLVEQYHPPVIIWSNPSLASSFEIEPHKRSSLITQRLPLCFTPSMLQTALP